MFDIGVMFQRAPDVSLTADGMLATNPQCKSDLEKEQLEIQDKADAFRFYPVLAFGISYSF